MPYRRQSVNTPPPTPDTSTPTRKPVRYPWLLLPVALLAYILLTLLTFISTHDLYKLNSLATLFTVLLTPLLQNPLLSLALVILLLLLTFAIFALQNWTRQDHQRKQQIPQEPPLPRRATGKRRAITPALKGRQERLHNQIHAAPVTDAQDTSPSE